MNDIDIKLKLLSGSSFFVDNIELKPFKLKEIKDIGYNRYFQLLNFFMINLNDLVDISEVPNNVKLNVFDLIINSNYPELINSFSDAIKLFLRQKIINVDIINNLIYLGRVNKDISKNKIINRDNFNQIIEVLKIQHNIKPEALEKYQNDRAREIAEKLKKSKELVNKHKNSEDNEIGDFSDLISAVCGKSPNISLNSVWSLTFYQFYDQFNRLNIIDNYDISIHCLMQGAKDINLKHWSSKVVLNN